MRRALGEAKEETTETDFALLGQIMGELLRWIVKGGKLDTVGRRAIALAWVVNPDIFASESAAKLARLVGCHPITLQKETGEVSRAFGHRNHAQSHGWNFKK